MQPCGCWNELRELYVRAHENTTGHESHQHYWWTITRGFKYLLEHNFGLYLPKSYGNQTQQPVHWMQGTPHIN